MQTYKERLIERLSQGETLFAYKKQENGEYRPAIGTTKESLIPKDKLPKVKKDEIKTGKTPTHDAIPYFDLQINEWRSVKVSNLIELPTV